MADPSAERARRVLADRSPVTAAGGGNRIDSPERAGLLDGAGGFIDTQEQDNPGGTAAGHAQQHLPTPIRWRTGIRAGVLIAVVSLVLAGGFWLTASGSGPQVMPLSAVSPAAGMAPNSSETGSTGSGGSEGAPAELAGKLVVHVAGAVQRPGIVELNAGSRVHEAITAAGGSTPEADLNQLNLAALLEDGQKLLVPRMGEQLSSSVKPEGAPGGGQQAGGKVNLNTATVEELGALPRVGPVLAQRIVDWRQDHGSFKTVEELDAVDGVGPKMLETLLPLVSV